MNNVIGRVLESRTVLEVTEGSADSVFLKKITLPAKLLRACEVSGNSDQLKMEARRQFLVSLCSAFEVYWKWVLQDAVGNYEFSSGALARMKSKEYRIGDIYEILGQSISLGELLSHSVVFNSADKVNAFCLDVFEYDLFRELGKSKLTIVALAPGLRRELDIDGEVALAARAKIEQCFEIRNLTVHSFATHHEVTAAQVDEFFGAMVRFNSLAYAQLRFDLMPSKTRCEVDGDEKMGYVLPGQVLLNSLQSVFGEFEDAVDGKQKP